MWEKDVFRKAVDKVGKTETTNLRAALETASKRHIARNQVDIDDEVVQHFFLHQRSLSLTRYMTEGAEKMCQILWGLVDPDEGDVMWHGRTLFKGGAECSICYMILTSKRECVATAGYI